MADTAAEDLDALGVLANYEAAQALAETEEAEEAEEAEKAETRSSTISIAKSTSASGPVQLTLDGRKIDLRPQLPDICPQPGSGPGGEVLFGEQSTKPKRITRSFPSLSSVIWPRLKKHGITVKEYPDAPIDPRLTLNDEKIEAFQTRFRWIVVTYIDILFSYAAANAENVPYHEAMVTYTILTLLRLVPREFIVKVICNAISQQAQCILGNPDFTYKDLLQLPTITKFDSAQGVYADVLTYWGNVKAVYVGSGTGYGSRRHPGGLIGRLLSYFWKGSTFHIKHEYWLHGPVSHLVQPHFVIFANMDSQPYLSSLYTRIIEDFLVVLLSIDLISSKQYEYRPDCAIEMAIEPRRRIGLRYPADIVYLNSSFPAKQGYEDKEHYAASTPTDDRKRIDYKLGDDELEIRGWNEIIGSDQALSP